MLCVYFLPQVLLHINICSYFLYIFIFFTFLLLTIANEIFPLVNLLQHRHTCERAQIRHGQPRKQRRLIFLLCCFHVIFIMEPANGGGLPTKREREREREKEIERESARARESESVCVCEREREGERESGAMMDNRGVRGRISSRVTCGENS
jgi:hypothetical protein